MFCIYEYASALMTGSMVDLQTLLDVVAMAAEGLVDNQDKRRGIWLSSVTQLHLPSSLTTF